MKYELKNLQFTLCKIKFFFEVGFGANFCRAGIWRTFLQSWDLAPFFVPQCNWCKVVASPAFDGKEEWHGSDPHFTLLSPPFRVVIKRPIFATFRTLAPGQNAVAATRECPALQFCTF